jgi:hypothetical protein
MHWMADQRHLAVHAYEWKPVPSQRRGIIIGQWEWRVVSRALYKTIFSENPCPTLIHSEEDKCY